MSRTRSDVTELQAAQTQANMAGESPSRVRHGVLAALCLAALIAYVQRNSISVAEAAMREDLALTKEQMSRVMAAFFLSYAIFQLPTGWLGKIWGTRLALPVFAALWSVLTGSFAIAWGLPTLWLARFGMGAAQAGIFPCAVNTISKWLPDYRRSLANGMLGSFMSVGGALGVALTGVLLPLIGWRAAFGLYCLPGLVFAAWFYFWFRDYPARHKSVNDAELLLIRGSRDVFQSEPGVNEKPSRDVEVPETEPTPWREILTSVTMWALCGQQFFRAAGYIFFATWFATYLRETRGVGDMEAGLLNSLPLLAVVIGSPLGGWISDRILTRTGSRRLSRQGVAIVSLLACCALILLSYGIANVWLAVLAISAGSFCAAFGNPCSYTATIDIGGKHIPMVFGVMNMMGNVGAFVFPMLVPWLLQEGETPGSGNWDLVLFTFAGMYLAAAFCWLLADVNVTIGTRTYQNKLNDKPPRE